MSTQIEKHWRLRIIGLAVLALPQVSPAQETVSGQLTVGQAIQFALKNSPTLRASRAEVAAAQAETGSARARQRPQLSANGFLSQGSMPNVLQSAMGVEPQALVIAPEKGFADANLMLMAPLYSGFLSGLVVAATAREKAAAAEASGMAAEVALRVREAYIGSLYAAEMVRASQSRVIAAEEMVRTSRAQLEAGKGIEATVKRAEAELAEAKQDLTTAENDRRKMLLDLLAEMGASLDSTPTLAESLAYKPLDLALQSFLDKAREGRGELLAARQRVRAAQGQTSSAEGSLRPQVYGFAMGDAFRPRDMSGNSAGYTVGLTVSLPIFDGGMRRSDVAAARAMADRARAEADRWELLVAKEVRQAWLDTETAAQNFGTAQSALTAAQSAFEVMAIRVASGKAILLEQLDALAVLTRARANVAKAMADHQLAVARLYRAAGSVEGLQ